LGKKWTKEEEDLCKQLLVEGKNYDEIAIILNKSVNAIKNKNRKHWRIFNQQNNEMSYEEIEDIFKQYNLILDKTVKMINKSKQLKAYTKEGYIVTPTLSNLIAGHNPALFNSSNPYTMWNIKNIWLPKNAPEYELLSEKYTNATEKDLIWQLKDKSYPPFNMQWSVFQNGSRNPYTQYERGADKKRHPKEKVLQMIENIFENDSKYAGWQIKDGEIDKYRNSQSKLVFVHKNGYLGLLTLLDLQYGYSFELFHTNRKEISLHNLNKWLELNSSFILKEGQKYTGISKDYIFICLKHGEFKCTIPSIIHNKYICKGCLKENISGENSSHWNHELSVEEREKRRNRKFMEDENWNKVARKHKMINNYTCEACGYKGKKKFEIVSHHKDNWKDYPDLRYYIENLACLCKKCHIDFHSEYGNKNNTLEQYEKWIIEQRKLMNYYFEEEYTEKEINEATFYSPVLYEEMYLKGKLDD